MNEELFGKIIYLRGVETLEGKVRICTHLSPWFCFLSTDVIILIFVVIIVTYFTFPPGVLFCNVWSLTKRLIISKTIKTHNKGYLTTLTIKPHFLKSKRSCNTEIKPLQFTRPLPSSLRLYIKLHGFSGGYVYLGA